jgi:hypothetical protein
MGLALATTRGRCCAAWGDSMQRFHAGSPRTCRRDAVGPTRASVVLHRQHDNEGCLAGAAEGCAYVTRGLVDTRTSTPDD